MKYWITTFLSTMVFLTLQAQGSEPAMADMMRENGKIYVVVGVMTILFLVLFAYLISIDRKLRKIEQDNKSQ